MLASTKTLIPIFENIPEILRRIPHWVCWRKVSKGEKVAKVPYRPNGWRADVTDLATWSTFDDCRAAYDLGGFAGIGFVLDGQPINGRYLIGIDIDGLTSATVRPAALYPLLTATYHEKSPSAQGVRAFAWSDQPWTMKRDGKEGWPGVEVYTEARYLTVTGHGKGALANVSAELVALDAAMEAHPSRMRGKGVRTNVAALPALHAADAIRLRRLDPGWESARGELSGGMATSSPDHEKLREPVLHLANCGEMSGEAKWTIVAQALAREAHHHPDDAEAIYSILDEASQVAGGNYDAADNRRRFDRFVQASAKPGYDARTILRLAREAGWQPSASTLPAAGPICAAAMPLPPKRHWLHGTDTLRGSVSLLVAPGGRGKSAWLIGLAFACATGRLLLAAPVHAAPGGLKVLYVNAEDGTAEISRRVRGAMTRHGLGNPDVTNLQVAGVDRLRLTLLTGERGEVKLNAAGLDDLKNAVLATGADLLILDPLANLSAVTLNDNHAATMLMAALTRLAVDLNIGIIIAHHTAKGRDVTSQEAASGAAAIVNSARISLAIEGATPNDASVLGVMPDQVGRFFHVISTKANLSPSTSARRWFELVSVELPNAEPPIYPFGDSVQVVVPYTPKPGASPAGPDATAAAVEAIRTAAPPLADDKRAKDRYALPVLAAAIAPHLPSGRATEADARAVLDTLLRQGVVRVQQMKVARRTGRGGDDRQCLVVTAT